MKSRRTMLFPGFLAFVSLFPLTCFSFDLRECTEKTQDWSRRQMSELKRLEETTGDKPGDPQKLRSLLFFLHIPRTGGRTYHMCFLKSLYPPRTRCERSYDQLRLDPANPECRLLSTHNDYSLLSRLPLPNTSVVTNLRDPLDRILSSYEFTVENAARSLKWLPVLQPKAGQSAWGAMEDARKKLSSFGKVETRKVWPWSELIPVMEEDLWVRRNLTRPMSAEQLASPPPPPPAPMPTAENPYEVAHAAMPLSDFVSSDAASELVHNGQTFQVAGLCNNSLDAQEAKEIRSCVREHPSVGALVLAVAKARLDAMLYVGLSEVHQQSAVLFAAIIGRELRSRPFIIPDMRIQLLTNQLKVAKEEDKEKIRQQLEGLEKAQAEVTLLSHYHRCVKIQRARYTKRRRQALESIGFGVRFNNASRQAISSELQMKIRSLNELDTELLDYARQIFKRRMRQYENQIETVEDIQEEEEKKRREEAEKAVEKEAFDPGDRRRRRLMSLHRQKELLSKQRVPFLTVPLFPHRKRLVGGSVSSPEL